LAVPAKTAEGSDLPAILALALVLGLALKLAERRPFDPRLRK